MPLLRLGIELAALRSQRGLDAKDAARHVGISPSQLSKIENGARAISEEQLRKLLDFYGLDDDERSPVEHLAAATTRTAWWDRYDDVLPAGLETYVGLEQTAEELDAVEVTFIHGLAQTEAYAHATLTALLPGYGPANIDRAVKLRMNRQRILHEPDRRIHLIIDEMALHRVIGGPEVMRGQLRRLREVAEMPVATVQVIPLTAGAHIGQDGPFTVLTYRANTSRDQDWRFVYTGGPFGNLYESKQKTVLEFVDRYARLIEAAASAEETLKIIDMIEKEYT